LTHGCVYEIVSWNWPSHPVEKCPFLSPKHNKISKDRKYTNNGLEGNKETDKKIKINDVNVLVTDLELHVCE
jgi:hypothetical protein